MVLHVFHASAPPVAVADMPAEIAPLTPVTARELEDDLRRFCEPVLVAASGLVQTTIKEGHPAKEIGVCAKEVSADLLVMGTHGPSGFEQLFLDSVTEKVLRITHVPVLTVPLPVEHPTSVLYKTILCPVEFSDASTRALEYALSLAEETDARLILLHVVEGTIEQPSFSEIGHLSVSEYYRNLRDDALARLKAAVPEEARVWCKPDERVTTGKAYREILRVATEDRAELIVMGVHGSGALTSRLFGSTTHHIIREAGCPVLTLRA